MNQNPAPVFIVGMPRSGTTLLSDILNVHPNIALVRETTFISYWSQMFDHLYLQNKQGFMKMWQMFANSLHVRRTGLEIETVKQALLDTPERTLKDVHKAFLQAYATRYNATCWGEKNPQYELHLSTIFSWYPDARVIFLVRDPRAVISSLRRAPWSHGSVWLHAIEYRRSHAVLLRYKHDSRVLVVHYEDLVTNKAVVLRTICKHIRQPFSENILEHSKHEGCQEHCFDQLQYSKDTQRATRHVNDERSPVPAVLWKNGERSFLRVVPPW